MGTKCFVGMRFRTHFYTLPTLAVSLPACLHKRNVIRKISNFTNNSTNFFLLFKFCSRVEMGLCVWSEWFEDNEPFTRVVSQCCCCCSFFIRFQQFIHHFSQIVTENVFIITFKDTFEQMLQISACSCRRKLEQIVPPPHRLPHKYLPDINVACSSLRSFYFRSSQFWFVVIRLEHGSNHSWDCRAEKKVNKHKYQNGMHTVWPKFVTVCQKESEREREEEKSKRLRARLLTLQA